MIVALHIVVYILTLVFMWFLTLNDLREERKNVTVGDVLTDIPSIMYMPIINTITLIIIGTAFFSMGSIWSRCSIQKNLEQS